MGEISAIYCNREGGMQFYCTFLRILTHCVRQNGKFCPPGFWYRDEGGYSSWGSIEPISFDGGSHQCWGRFEAKNRCLPSLSHFSQAGIHLSLSLSTLFRNLNACAWWIFSWSRVYILGIMLHLPLHIFLFQKNGKLWSTFHQAFASFFLRVSLRIFSNPLNQNTTSDVF